MNRKFLKKLRKIKLLALDFDGTLTDGFVYTDRYGKELVRTSRRDSLGLNALRHNGFKLVVISTEKSDVVRVRCDKLKIESFSGIPGNQKLEVLKRYMDENNIFQSQVAYMGDDINDIECLLFAGLAITVSDGHKSCRKSADYVTRATGGNHAVREVCDLLLKAKGVSCV